MFFESSSELANSVDDLRGRPNESLLAAAELLLPDGELVEPASFSFVVPLFPYLFFKYLAHELRTAPSFSVVDVDLSGEGSLDFNVWEERLLARSCPGVVEPYPLDAK